MLVSSAIATTKSEDKGAPINLVLDNPPTTNEDNLTILMIKQ